MGCPTDRPPLGTSLIGVANGDPYNPLTSSGAPRFLFDALGRRYGGIERIDYSLRGWHHAAMAALTFRTSRDRWQERFHLNSVSHCLRSRQLLSALDRTGRNRLMVQVYGWVEPPGIPQVNYVDHTWHLASEQWRPWLPSHHRDWAFWFDVERRMYRASRHVFTMSQPAAESLVSFYGVQETRVTVVGGGVNFESLPEVRRHPREPPVILFVGRDYARKGGDVLVEAFRTVRARLPGVRLRFAGTDRAPREPGIEVLGEVSERGRVGTLYGDATVFCLPSRYEPWGFAFAEAMAHGLPCVGTTAGGMPEIIVHGKTGMLVPPGDPVALANALLLLLEDRAWSACLGAAGRRRVETELNWDRVVDRMELGLDAALNGD